MKKKMAKKAGPMHKMSGGMMMSDGEMAAMMEAKKKAKPAKKAAKKKAKKK